MVLCNVNKVKWVQEMRHLVKFSFSLMLVTGLLSACGTTNQTAVQLPEEVVEAEPQEAQEPELPSLFFSWSLREAILIAPPVAIQTEAISACRTRGFDASYMIHISIEGDDAIAEFGCRGADQ